MPVNIVQPGQEHYWTKAKALAAKQGHAEDWPYIVGIFQKMTKSETAQTAAMRHADVLGAGASKRKKVKAPEDKVAVVMREFERGTLRSGSGEVVRDRKQALAIAMSEAGLSKSGFGDRGSPAALEDAKFVIRERHRGRIREVGQVPTHANLEALKLMEAPPKAWHLSAYTDRPRMTSNSVLDGMGLAKGQYESWKSFLDNEARSASNEVVLRRCMLEKMMTERMDSERRRALFERVMDYHRMRKSGVVRVWDPNELRKAVDQLQQQVAQPQQQQQVQPQAGPNAGAPNQVAADDWRDTAIRVAILEQLKSAMTGVHLDDLASIVKQYGAQRVGGVLQFEVQKGSIKWENGLLHIGAEDEQGAKERQDEGNGRQS